MRAACADDLHQFAFDLLALAGVVRWHFERRSPAELANRLVEVRVLVHAFEWTDWFGFCEGEGC